MGVYDESSICETLNPLRLTRAPAMDKAPAHSHTGVSEAVAIPPVCVLDDDLPHQ